MDERFNYNEKGEIASNLIMLSGVSLVLILVVGMIGSALQETGVTEAIQDNVSPYAWSVLGSVMMLILAVFTTIFVVKRFLAPHHRAVRAERQAKQLEEIEGSPEWLSDSLSTLKGNLLFHEDLAARRERNTSETLAKLYKGLLELRRVVTTGGSESLKQELDNKYYALLEKLNPLVSREYWGELISSPEWWTRPEARLDDVEERLLKVTESITSEIQRAKGIDMSAEASLRFIDQMIPDDEFKELMLEKAQ